MNEEQQKQFYEDLLSDLDLEDEKYIIVDYDVEKPEVRFRWEYAHESSSEHDSVFRKILPET